MAGRVGLVVAGAGARGAYEAGALSVLVPRMAADGATPTVLVGTSAGALNIVALAGLAHLRPEQAASALVDLWSDVRLPDVAGVLTSIVDDGLRYSAQLLGLPVRLPSLLDTTRQRATLERLLPLDTLHANVRNGLVDAVAVATTSAATGSTVVFVEKRDAVPLPPRDANRNICYVETRLTVDHVLASAAVPVAFRPVKVTRPEQWRGWYVDGGLRLNVPLKPALALGCDRLGVVATSPASWPPPQPSMSDSRRRPDVFRAAALSLESLLADRMVEDLHTLSTVNELVASDRSRAGYRRVPFLFAGPPADEADAVGRLADAVFAREYAGLRGIRAPALWLLDRLIGGAAADHGDLLSFLFFDGAFTRPAAALGAAQARDVLGIGAGGTVEWDTVAGSPSYVDLIDPTGAELP